jgi:hypothetical protein
MRAGGARFPTRNKFLGVAPYVGLIVLYGWWAYASAQTLFDVILGGAIVATSGCMIFLGRRRVGAMDFRRK